ncbi:acylphosphatase [Aerosakkonemataceae cyanobacterium BLCC-F154]|uniref:acylphosphatase n=1 Tax=Floridaenema fluviatile BLCC-F154 TaxID=3153640 RepID=A0ABV4YJL5_9CYAN
MTKESQTNLIRVHVFVSGSVQGVGYRYSTYNQAKQLGVNGWVRNLADGRVEAVFEGEKAAVDRIILWCHQGSRSAVVKNVAVQSEQPQGLTNFEIKGRDW